MLAACPYSGAAADAAGLALNPETAEFEEALAPNKPDVRPTLARLKWDAQCSAAELHTALQRFRALEVGGRWCVLEAQFESDVVESLLALAVEREWPLEAIPLAAAAAELAEQFDELSVRSPARAQST